MPFDLSAQIAQWKRKLLNTDKRNPQINFKTGKTGGIPLLHPHPADLWTRLVLEQKGVLKFVWKQLLVGHRPVSPEGGMVGSLASGDPAEPSEETSCPDLEDCLRSPRLEPTDLLTELSDQQLARRLTGLARKTNESLRERGINILYVAFGFVRWFESSSSEVEYRAPLLLLPVRLARNTVESPWQLRAEDEEADVLANQSLVQRFDSELRLRLPLPDTEVDEYTPSWRTDYFDQVRRCVQLHDPRWDVLDEVALGMFSFQKLAMWEDLERNADRIKAHQLCREIAGDRSDSPRCPGELFAARELDQKTKPIQTFHILDADSSQHEAIEAAKRGLNLVLDGPPGTGKSQTIANIIAEFLAARKTVLFVSEKAAALDVVYRRLQEKQLADFCLYCHSHNANKREVIAELGRCLELLPESNRSPEEELRQLQDIRGRLNRYVHQLHEVRQPLGNSIYEVHGLLARLGHLRGKSRFSIPHILERDHTYLKHITDLLDGLPACREVVSHRDHHPWRGCRATVYSSRLLDDVQYHFGRLVEFLVGAEKAMDELHGLGLAPANATIRQWHCAVDVARTILSCPQIPAHWFQGNPRSIAETVIQIDDLSKAYQEQVRALPELARSALQAADARALSEITLSPETLRLIRDPADTAKSLHQRMRSFAERCEDLHQQSLAVGQLERKVVELLGRSHHPQPIRVLPRLAELANLIASIRAVCSSWWDAGRRSELLTVVVRYQEREQEAQKIRTELATRLLPQAFKPEAGKVANRVIRYRSFWSRLLPGWWSLKAEVSGWYDGVPPNTPQLLADLEKLAAYHRHLDCCRDIKEQYGADVLRGPTGEPDWRETLKQLRRFNQLATIAKNPEVFRPLLTSEKGVDRRALAAAAQELNRRTEVLVGRLEELARTSDLSPPPEAVSGFAEKTAFGLADQLGVLTSTVRQQGALLERVIGLFADGRDISAKRLPDMACRLARLGTLRLQVADRSSQLRPEEASAQPPEEQDWATLRPGADGFLLFSNAWKGELSAPVIRGLTLTEVRARLSEVVRQSDLASADHWEESWRFLAELFAVTEPISTGITIEEAPLGDLRQWLAGRAKDTPRIREWIQFGEIETDLARAEASPFLTEVLSGKIAPEEAADAFRARFFSLWLDAIYEQVPELRQFTTDHHERLINRFQDLDQQAVRAAALRIRAIQLSRSDRQEMRTIKAPKTSPLGTLRREVNKKRRHLPLRNLFTTLSDLLLRLKPCMMMSPLAVSTYLNPDTIHFDLVIFDEASQVRPYDAICAIYRGKQLIVAGDQKQLPPTNFFERKGADEETADEEQEEHLEDFESILDVCCTLQLPRKRLRWHYRSRREGLIAFSNRFIYDEELVTFPSVLDTSDNPAVTLEYVPNGRWKTGKSINPVEARRTAELVIEHFRQSSRESLGVIAFGGKQQELIEDELERLRKTNPDLEDFFKDDRTEPFFVKNLETVQGDERDVIFLCVGYGPDDDGRVKHHFLNRQGDERRLNVAVTRAKNRLKVISSMRAHDIDLSRTEALGVKLLRAYLEYAELGPEALHRVITKGHKDQFDSPFEEEVFHELTRRGLKVHSQVGCSSFRIDLAVVDPRAPGRYLLGVECDGASYHSSATARDRDRLRQQVLESLGWQICRIWSTDWLRDRESQVRRVLSALEKAKRGEPARAFLPYGPRPNAPMKEPQLGQPCR